MSVSLNLDDIEFQSALRSKPVRDNFTDLQNACNDLQSQIDTLATPPAGTEVTNARDYHSVLRDRLRSASSAQGNCVITGGAVTQQGSPNMTVAVAAGEALVAGVACKWVGSNSGTITAPVSNPRYDIVVVNSDSTLSIVAGSEAASPVMPAWSLTQKPLAILSLTVGMTSIVTSNISDIRKILGGKKQIFTNSGTWKWNGICQKVKVIIVGAGGNGGNGGGGSASGGGGGGGGQVIERYIDVSSDVTVTVGKIGSAASSFGSVSASGGSVGGNGVAGLGGAGGAGGNGGSGGGGGGGQGIVSGGKGGDYYGANGVAGTTGNGAGGAAGVASYGQCARDFYAGGSPGTATSSSSGGGGGAGYAGNGGNGGSSGTGNVAQSGQGYGAGGGGASGSGSTVPGNGYQGIVIIEEVE